MKVNKLIKEGLKSGVKTYLTSSLLSITPLVLTYIGFENQELWERVVSGLAAVVSGSLIFFLTFLLNGIYKGTKRYQEKVIKARNEALSLIEKNKYSSLTQKEKEQLKRDEELQAQQERDKEIGEKLLRLEALEQQRSVYEEQAASYNSLDSNYKAREEEIIQSFRKETEINDAKSARRIEELESELKKYREYFQGGVKA